jgi:hypothetical protein
VTVSFAVPDEVVEAIAARAAELVTETLTPHASPWMTRTEAAEYLRVPVSRLEKDKTVPCRRWDGRVLYHRAELDAWLVGAR